MSRTWIVLLVTYAAFFFWYTSFAGPMTETEISEYLATLEERGMAADRLAVWETFMRGDTGDDFAMLNVIELRETPQRVEGVGAGDSSDDVLARYTEPFLGRALRRAAHPILFGQAAAPALDIWGLDGADDWTSGGLVRYRSRRDLVEQAVFATTVDIHRFKTAAMAKTLAYPLDPWWHLGDPRVLLGLVLLVLGFASQALRRK